MRGMIVGCFQAEIFMCPALPTLENCLSYSLMSVNEEFDSRVH